MASSSRSREKTRSSGAETSTPTYQKYAGEIVNSLYPSMMNAYNISMQGYGQPGYNPYQMGLWSQVGQQAADKWGTTGPYAAAAEKAIAPYLGEGYMATLNPYFQKQQQYIESALPQEKKSYLQQLKNEFGPAWGTSGKALAAAGESYANWQAGKARELAGLEAQKAQAQQAGMGYGLQAAPAYAQMANPFTWGQQAIQWAGAPEEATMAGMQSQQQLATGWSNPLASIAAMGYQYPSSTTTAGQQTSVGESRGSQYGMNCCFIMNETGDLTKKVRNARDSWWPTGQGDVPTGYRRMANWLVPLMQKSPLVKWLVRNVMTHPISVCLERPNLALYPIGMFWVTVWALYGRLCGGAHATDREVFKGLHK